MCEKCILEAAEETQYTSPIVKGVNISFGDKGRGLVSSSLEYREGLIKK